MFKKKFLVPADVRKKTWLIALACLLALGASACTIPLPANSLTPTPTTLMGYLATVEVPTGNSTEGPPPTASALSDDSDLDSIDDICALISWPEAETVLGQPVIDASPGTDDDSVTGGTLDYCSYLGSGIALVFTRVELDSAQAADLELQRQLAQMLSDDSSTTSDPVARLGDRAFWTTTENATGFTVLQGNVVFSLVLGGQIGDPAAHRAALQALTEILAGRL